MNRVENIRLEDQMVFANAISRNRYIHDIPRSIVRLDTCDVDSRNEYVRQVFDLFDSTTAGSKAEWVEKRSAVAKELAKKGDIFQSWYKGIIDKESFLEMMLWTDALYPNKRLLTTLFQNNKKIFLDEVANGSANHAKIFGKLLINFGEDIAYELATVLEESQEINNVDIGSIAENASYFRDITLEIIGTPLYRKMGLPKQYIQKWKKTISESVGEYDISSAIELYNSNRLLPLNLFSMNGIVHFSSTNLSTNISVDEETRRNVNRDTMIVYASSIYHDQYLTSADEASAYVTRLQRTKRNIGFRRIEYSAISELKSLLESIHPLTNNQLVLCLEDHGDGSKCGRLGEKEILELVHAIQDVPIKQIIFNSCFSGQSGGLAEKVSMGGILCVGQEVDTSLSYFRLPHNSQNNPEVRYVVGNAMYYKFGKLQKMLTPKI